jgi:hypothetical protein
MRRTYSDSVMKQLAAKCGLTLEFHKVGDDWEWFASRGKIPCFQGSGADLVVWLQGYRRCIEDHMMAKPEEDTWNRDS